jgi:hypothetical protein
MHARLSISEINHTTDLENLLRANHSILVSGRSPEIRRVIASFRTFANYGMSDGALKCAYGIKYALASLVALAIRRREFVVTQLAITSNAYVKQVIERDDMLIIEISHH